MNQDTATTVANPVRDCGRYDSNMLRSHKCSYDTD